MADERQLLIVKPEGIVPTDDAIETLLEELFKVQDFQSSIERIKAYGTNLLSAYNPLFYLEKIQGKELQPFEKVVFLQESKPFLIHLIRRLYQLDLPRMMPEALVVSPDDVRLKNYQCSDSHFKTNIVYAEHPAAPNYFLRFAEFHEKLLEEKRHEFLQLLISLGAKKISWVDKNQQDKSGEASAGLDDPTTITDVGVQISTKQASSSALKIEGEFDLPTYFPKAPEDLKWLNRESSWKTVEHGRTQGNWMKTYKVSFTYAQDFGITSELDAKLKGFGLNIGGNFSSMRTIEQEYEVEFYSREDYKTIGDTVAISN